VAEKYKNRVSAPIKFGKGKRESLVKDQNPGPGHYNEEAHKHIESSGPKYHISGRHKEHESLNTPGPGSYERRSSTFSRVGGTISKNSY
jgi:hypothetical protein